MNRREFLGTSAGAVLALAAPLPSFAATPSASAPSAAVLRWFSVGDDEFCYPIQAFDLDDALREYALSSGKTVAEECPECGEPDCTEHNNDLDAPLPWLDAHDHGWGEKEPTSVDWVRAGYNTFCDHCQPHGGGSDEATECQVFGNEVLCSECLELARIDKLERIIGVKEG